MSLTVQEQNLLDELTHRMREAAGANLESVVLYGSAAAESDGYHPGISDLNVLCLLRNMDAQSLRQIAPVLKWWNGNQQPSPMLFSAAELLGSADSFPIELRDMKDRHRALYGPDPLASLNVPMELHRVQLEHELRVNLIRLRQRYAEAAEDAQQVAGLMLESASSLVTLLRHLLIASGENPPTAGRDVARRAASLAGFDPLAVEVVVAAKKDGGHNLPANAEQFPKYLAAMEAAVRYVDGLASRR